MSLGTCRLYNYGEMTTQHIAIPASRSRIAPMAPARASATSALLMLALLLPACGSAKPAPAPTSVPKTKTAPAEAGAFVYRPALAADAAGTLYHYTKSNRDGTRAAQLKVFIASEARMEVLKLEPWSNVAVLVTADMDWGTFSPVKLEAFHIHAGDRKEPTARLEFTPASRTMQVQIGERTQSLTVEKLPYHVYNFDFGSLNFAFRHLESPEASFQVAIVDPNWAASESDPRIMLYKGLVAVEFAGHVDHKGRPARRYRVFGPGLDGSEGYIVVNREAGHIELMEFPLATSPDYSDFRLELTSIERLAPEAWDAWMME